MKSLKSKIKKAIEIVLNSEISLVDIDAKEEEVIILEDYQKLLDRIAVRVIEVLKEDDLEKHRKASKEVDENTKKYWDKIKEL